MEIVRGSYMHSNLGKLVLNKANCSISSHCLCPGQRVALEHTAKTTADGKLARMFCACVRRNYSLYQYISRWWSVFLVQKGETGRPFMVDMQTVVMINQHSPVISRTEDNADQLVFSCSTPDCQVIVKIFVN